MPDSDQIARITAVLDDDMKSLTKRGMVARHEGLAGRVKLIYSEKQRQETAASIANVRAPTPTDLTGCIIALDIESGKVVRYTDVDVLKGNSGAINYQICPNYMSRSFHNDNGLIYGDMRLVADVDPRNLIALRTVHGQDVNHFFESTDPNNGSLVAYYGKDKALDIVRMLSALPEDIRPKGVHNGVDKVDSFDYVLTNKRSSPSTKSLGRYGHCHPN